MCYEDININHGIVSIHMWEEIEPFYNLVDSFAFDLVLVLM